MSKYVREYIILDGQQRIATTVIILAAIRSWLRARDFERDANQIQNDYIEARKLGGKAGNPRLILNENNNPYFVNFVVRETPLHSIEKEIKNLKRYDPNRQLLQAISFCRSKIEKLTSSYADRNAAAEYLFDLVNYLEDGVRVVRFTVSNEADAYTIFETLNDRGLDLTVLDLIKNYIFGKTGSNERLRDTQKIWTQMMANLANVPADDYLKAWWTSRNGRVQTAQLFPKFKNKINSWSKVDKTTSDMLLASEHYSALGIADDSIWADLSMNARNRIRSLKLLGAKQVHPVLLSALIKFSPKELERLLRLLEVLIVRYQLIGGGRTGRLEISSASLAHQIWSGHIKTATAASTVVKDIYPSDAEFREAFKLKQERNNQKASWVLAKLEGQARQASSSGVAAHELEPSGSLTLEHVLPKKPGKDWDEEMEIDPTFAEELTFRIGNMCLLSQVNRKLGNAGFDEKKKVYSESDLKLTYEIANRDSWTREAVEQRQARLAKLAVAYWRFE